MEGFGGLDGVKKGKGELFDYLRLKDSAKAFVNANHEVLMEISKGLDCVYYGSDEHEPVARFVKDGGRKFVWAKGGFKSEELEVNLEGDYNLDNIATAIACGLEFQVDEKDIGEAISEYMPSNNRSQTTKTEKNTIILDAYNANLQV